MITSKEARKLYEEHKNSLNQEALESIEKHILEACKRGEAFCELQKIPALVIEVLKEKGYSVISTNILISINGNTKSVAGFKIFW